MANIQLPYKWSPREYQKPVFHALQSGKVNRAVTIWHRRAGKSYATVNWAAVASQMRVGLILHVFPKLTQARKIIWEGRAGDGARLLDAFPEAIREPNGKNDQEMRLKLKNGSVYQLAGTDSQNLNALIGTNPIGIIMDEYSLQNPRAWDFLRPILAENGGWAWFVYTPRGKNHGHKLYTMACSNDKWYSQLLTAADTNAISKEAIQDELDAGMTEELCQQEFYCSWNSAMEGSYYSKEFSRIHAEGRICLVPWDPKLPVHTAWDIGVSDSNSIIYFQKRGREVAIIDYDEGSGHGLQHYVKILREKPYHYGAHIAPHDIKQFEYALGKTRIEAAAEMGIQFEVCPKLDLMDGIDAARLFLNRCVFDEGKTENLVSALIGYRRLYDDNLQTFKDKPLHDWCSHAADAFRYLALMIDEVDNDFDNQGLQTQAIHDYDMFSIGTDNNNAISSPISTNFNLDSSGDGGFHFGE